MLTAIICIIICLGLIVAGVALYGKHQMGKIPGLSFQEALAYTTQDNAEAVITVGIIRNGQASYMVYGENGAVLPQELHIYEIGSLTKTFTAAMVARAVREGKVDLDSTIDKYIAVPEGAAYPTIKELLTHTSGYKGYYFESPMVGNFFKKRNDFYGITKAMVLDRIGKISWSDEEYIFSYSNFGYAVLGLVLEAVYARDYATLLNQFTQEELSLVNTHISDKKGDLGKYWDWKNTDAYLSAGAITSDITDMLSYAQKLLDEYEYLKDCPESLKEINASTEQYQMMGIRMDEIGMSWIIDKEKGIVWHNGGTDNYNSYLGFKPETGEAVVVLSNLPPNYRIPAPVLGVKVFEETEEVDE